MATGNFVTTKFFPIVAMTNEEWEETRFDFPWILDAVNENFLFFRARFQDGYYEGVQLIFDELYNPEEMDNEDTRYEFDLCRSVAIRKYHAEINKINRMIDKLCKETEWCKYGVSARFSSGETWYSKI